MANAPDPAEPVVEQSTVDELVKLLGQAEMDMLLGELSKRLADLTGGVLRADAPDLAGLRRDAHALISQSGNLGFRELSAASRKLCDSIRGPDWSDEASARLGEVREAAARAQAELGRRLKAA